MYTDKAKAAPYADRQLRRINHIEVITDAHWSREQNSEQTTSENPLELQLEALVRTRVERR